MMYIRQGSIAADSIL